MFVSLDFVPVMTIAQALKYWLAISDFTLDGGCWISKKTALRIATENVLPSDQSGRLARGRFPRWKAHPAKMHCKVNKKRIQGRWQPQLDLVL